jgi:hypothetical protein
LGDHLPPESVITFDRNTHSRTVFRTTDEIIDGCCDAWNWLLAETGRIRSLCSYPWLAQVST